MTDFSLELKDVRKSFGHAEIIRGANLQVPRGERFAIIGPNGAGKSTLFNLISGRFGISSGAILLNGSNIAGLQPYQINRRGLSRSFQITNIFHRLSVYENLRCAVLWSLGYRYSFWHCLNALRDVHQRAEAVLEQIGLTRRRHTTAGLLTYAEQRALEIGITIAGGAEVILLDEPTAGMSRSESDAAVELIRKISVGKTLLMVEHDMSVVFGLADKIAVVVYGEVIACDTPQNIRNNQQVKDAYLGGHAPQEISA
ncbi:MULTISPECIES: ABC transporter ATP-binding protein [unclassified Undibacterium]|uniref:ABC transporter ATP-binding protein n=1 Tax=unclassified Undibacterium TaxID=2630295 RepID=UPI002AC9DBF9|nr:MULTISPECIES: ABC transporter ATP-binding protein [unclassified Undibacterium]MEB0139509.1 ABC transporter ATP-binding protein [Undibacterium sp. CCC2.1]MEB0172382.1 ABC transporter ATP-binding protein [Undibacterium sp. CCC1.1]MEB0175709.1 ABC transporter ATP-binding protein [Undibacterium sp. CCC3.4]MEB0214497.1 ABC transporter ATP-binding protein [Undibacterium sp. 5I2]WPX42892.1 ABC transporter ATP-binding protein [Undibacterium sp. CCC3.4]